MMKTTIICTVLCLALQIAANPCKDGELIESAGIKCSAAQLINLLQAKDIATKCGIVLDVIRPCIIQAISADHNKTCTAREKHELILNFRRSIQQHLRFDVLQCLPVMNCSDYESVMYYLQVKCDDQFESYLSSSTCSNLCGLASCHADASIKNNKTCSIADFQQTISGSTREWEKETGSSKTDLCCSGKSAVNQLSWLLSGTSFLTFIFFCII